MTGGCESGADSCTRRLRYAADRRQARLLRRPSPVERTRPSTGRPEQFNAERQSAARARAIAAPQHTSRMEFGGFAKGRSLTLDVASLEVSGGVQMRVRPEQPPWSRGSRSVPASKRPNAAPQTDPLGRARTALPSPAGPRPGRTPVSRSRSGRVRVRQLRLAGL
jgi:hypothetical protein